MALTMILSEHGSLYLLDFAMYCHYECILWQIVIRITITTSLFTSTVFTFAVCFRRHLNSTARTNKFFAAECVELKKPLVIVEKELEPLDDNEVSTTAHTSALTTNFDCRYHHYMFACADQNKDESLWSELCHLLDYSRRISSEKRGTICTW